MKKNYFKNLMQVSLLLGAAFVISSCDDVIGQEDNPVASYVQWDAKTPASIQLTLGIDGKDTYQIKAVAVSSVVIVYESENPEIAKVDPVTGVITAVGVGETNIKAVVTGASAAGQSVFIPEEIKVPVIVKDGKAKLTLVKEEVIEYNVNTDSIIDLNKFFTGYPEIGTGDNKSDIAFTTYTYDYNSTTKKYDKNETPGALFGTINGDNEFVINGGFDDTKVDPKNFTDTLYVVGTISKAAGTNEYNYTDEDATKATLKIIINKSIAYINAKGEREILTADKYKTDIDFTKPIEAGTYYVGYYSNTSTNVVIKGDVTLISRGNSLEVNTLTDQTDNATLKIFGEAINTTTKGEYDTANPYIYVRGNNGDGISNFNQIDFYTGVIDVRTNKANCGAFENVKNINVFGGYLDARNSSSGYAINLKEGGKFTVDGGAAFAKAAGEDTKVSFAIVGDVNVKSLSKTGDFTAESAYRAVKGNVTKGDKIKLYNDEDKEIQDNSGNPKKITTVAPVAP